MKVDSSVVLGHGIVFKDAVGARREDDADVVAADDAVLDDAARDSLKVEAILEG